MLNLLSRTHWTALAVFAALLGIAVIALTDLGGVFPPLPNHKRKAPSNVSSLPISKAYALVTSNSVQVLSPKTNAVNPFFTTYFLPPPPPKAATTKKVDLTYQGFYANSEGQKFAFVRIGESSSVQGMGKKVVADLVVADISAKSLVLTNAASLTNVLEFNKKKEVEIPAQ